MNRKVPFVLVARSVWARQRLSRLVNLLNVKLSSSVVRVNWTIKPTIVEAIHGPESSSITPFAYSSGVVKGENLQTFRVICHLEDAASINSTTWMLETSEVSTCGIIADAEDARVFQFKGQLFIYFQESFRNVDGSQDCRIFVFDPRTSISRLVESPLSFSGKNWIPYEESGNLYFIYSLQPLIIMKVVSWGDSLLSTTIVHDESNFTNQEVSWGDENGSFGAIRGGSQLLRVADGFYIGFTHVTPSGILKFSHQAGVLLFNSREKTFKHKTLTKLKPGLLVDPFGIEIYGDRIRMIFSYSVNNPHEKHSIVGSSISTFNFRDLA